jgi:23S rRNA (cytosine1962-C5)-methyltransferase
VRSPRFRPRRYRLKAAPAAAVREGHPWVYRDKLSSVTEKFADGQWLELLDPHDGIVGYGIYHREGGVGIRVLGPTLPDVRETVAQAVRRRRKLQNETDAYRVINGENDGLPGVVLDVYAGWGVLQTYQPGVDSLGRYAAALACQQLELRGLVWKLPHRRIGPGADMARILRGHPPDVVEFHEGSLQLSADLLAGQKSGTFLDLRGLRRWLRRQPLEKTAVLNLFAYTGMAGLAACAAGAAMVVNVDAAQPSLDFGARHHAHPAQRWVCADIFRWLSTPDSVRYDLIIVDPPCMAYTMAQVPKALAAYRKLYTSVARRLKPGGRIVACCCTSRIAPAQFDSTLSSALPNMAIQERLPHEPDHRARFSEANYLKIVVLGPKRP